MCDFFFVNLDDFFVIVCTGFHKVVVCTRYVLLFLFFTWQVTCILICSTISVNKVLTHPLTRFFEAVSSNDLLEVACAPRVFSA